MIKHHDLGDQKISLQPFTVLGIACVKEVITANAHTKLPRHRVFWYVDAGKLPPLRPTALLRLSKPCKSFEDLVQRIERL